MIHFVKRFSRFENKIDDLMETIFVSHHSVPRLFYNFYWVAVNYLMQLSVFLDAIDARRIALVV